MGERCAEGGSGCIGLAESIALMDVMGGEERVEDDVEDVEDDERDDDDGQRERRGLGKKGEEGLSF